MATKKAEQCKATIFNGNPCKRKAARGSEYCTQHRKQKGELKKQPQDDAEVVTAAIPEPVGYQDPTQPPPDSKQVEYDGVRSGDYDVAELQKNPAFVKFEIAKRVAHTLANSNLVPDAYRGRPNDVFVAINMGAELGMEPFQAIQSIAVIDGKPCLYGDGLIGVVRANPKCLWIEEEIDNAGKIATCRTQRKGDPNPIERSYSMDDAVLAGISDKKNWKKHPKRMLQMRARAYCLRDAYPDLLKGLGVVEEMIDHEDAPAPITNFALPENQQPAQIEEAQPQVEVTLSQVEHAMMQSDTMEELLKTSDMTKHLSEADKKVARVTYKKMRNALMEE